MKTLSYLFLAAAIGAMYVLEQHRTSPLGMTLVEWQTLLGQPPPTILGLIGAGLLAFSRRGRKRTQRATRATPTQTERTSPSSSTANTSNETFDPNRDWLEQAREAAKTIRWPSGVRMSIDSSKPCPIELRIEQAPPERAKRAVSLLGNWLASIPLPPRARIVYQNCPEGGSPRHHQVAGALAESIHRGQFKTLSDLDAVDVMFHQPDPRWSARR